MASGLKMAIALILVLMAYFEWKRRLGAGEPVKAWRTIFLFRQCRFLLSGVNNWPTTRWLSPR